NGLSVQHKNSPMMAHWFFLDSLYYANTANRDGAHANALSITRQCIESMSVMEMGLCRHPEREVMLSKWWDGGAKPGHMRQWLAEKVWPSYGSGLWTESWNEFMARLSGAVQPYAHYTGQLAQWQMALKLAPRDDTTAIVEFRPRAYDPQKATRITLFHAIITYALGRVSIATATTADPEFDALVRRFGRALGKSKYLDGHDTNWDQQFWSIVWLRGSGETILE
ncbi:MAG: hypothetical protein NZ734_16880, partial [Paracoccus sp.]|nr:hypothetical protein [Paracoccus sp. (in: a-proteobacteria)]